MSVRSLPDAVPAEGGRFDAALGRAARALNDRLDPRALLRTLGEVALETTEATRISLFVMDGGRLVPMVSIGTHVDPQMHRLFVDSGPLLLDGAFWALLGSGDPVLVPDAATSPVLPRGWATRFAMESAVVLLLRSGQGPCGLLAADYPRRDAFAPNELQRLGTLAALAGVAVGQSQAQVRAARDVEAAGERERIATELRGTVQRLFALLHSRADALARRAPAHDPMRVWAAELVRLADGGAFQVEQAVRLLDHLPDEERGLVAAIRGLAVDLEEVSGIDVLVTVHGEPERLDPRSERALYRVVHEGLVGAWRHGRPMLIRVTVTFDPDQVRVVIVDDGAGLRVRHRESVTGRELLVIRRELTGVGGALEVLDRDPRGVEIRVCCPRGGSSFTG